MAPQLSHAWLHEHEFDFLSSENGAIRHLELRQTATLALFVLRFFMLCGFLSLQASSHFAPSTDARTMLLVRSMTAYKTAWISMSEDLWALLYHSL